MSVNRLQFVQSNSRRRHITMTDILNRSVAKPKNNGTSNCANGISKQQAEEYEQRYGVSRSIEVVAPVLDAIKNRICGGIEADYTFLLSCFAQMMQHPTLKPGVAILLVGTKYGAADYLIRLLYQLIGHQNVNVVADCGNIYDRQSAIRESTLHCIRTTDGVYTHYQAMKHIIGNNVGRIMFAVQPHSNGTHMLPQALIGKQYVRLIRESKCDTELPWPLCYNALRDVPPVAFALYLYKMNISDFQQIKRGDCKP